MSRFCTKCGATIPENSKFCTKCGATLGGTAVNPKPKAPTEKNTSSKNTFLIGLSTVAAGVLLLGGLAWYIFGPVGPNDNLVKENVNPIITQYNVAMRDKFNIKELKVQDKTVNDAKNHCELVVKINLESEDVKREHYYHMTFSKFEDSEWRMDTCQPYNEKAWKAEPLKGVGDNSIKNSLVGQTADGKYKKYFLDENKLADIKITEHKANLDKGYDEVKFDFNYKEKIAYIPMSAVADYEFIDGRWKLTNIKIDLKDEKIFLNKGYEFKKTDKELQEDMAKSPIFIKSQYGNQTVTISAAAVKNFKVNKKLFDWNKRTLTRECTFELEKKSAKLGVDAKLVYEYSASGWRVKEILYTPKLLDIDMKGVWKGTFLRWSKKRGSLVARIETQDANGLMTAIMETGPSASDPGCPVGSGKAIGGIDKETFVVTLKRDSWIREPDTYIESSLNFSGVFMVDDGKIIDANDKYFELAKISN